MTSGLERSAQGKGGFRNLKVVAKIVESSMITSFHLAAADGSALPAFRPGQFLVFKIPSGDAKGYVLRNYSLSGAPDDLRHYRISVKREPSAGPGLPVGLSSNYLHDSVMVGDVLVADGPRGEFVLDEASDRPVVLLSGGVGLTPMVSMMHALAHRSARRTLFLHACENGDVHALQGEVNGLIGKRPGLSAGVALVPLMIDAGDPGKEILNPVAVTIFGGLISSTLLDTFLTPVLFLRYGRKSLERLVDAARKDQDDARAPQGAAIQTF